VPKQKAVLDTTVYVSALVREGTGALLVLSAAVANKFEPIVSPNMIDEIERVLRLRGMPSDDVAEFLGIWNLHAGLVIPSETIMACRDPDDDKFLEAAVAANADYIVTGDKDLRVLSPFRGIEIVTVNKFLRRLGFPR